MKKEPDMQDENPKRLPIRPLKIPGKIKKVPVSKLIWKISEKSIEIPEAVVAYLDILGFAKKKNAEDMDSSLSDFTGPLVLAARRNPEVRFNVFSDCAFVSASRENSADLLSAIRFAFTQWVADGIPVRGGIALGSYRETYTPALDIKPKNFIGNLFSGSAVTAAVKLEDSGRGALLFTNEECAKFYAEKHGEPIFLLNSHRIIGWSDQDRVLYWFVGISLLQLLKILSVKDGAKDPRAEILLNNLKYSSVATDSSLPGFLVLAILSLPTIDPKARKRAIDLLEIKDPDDFVPYRELISEWLELKDRIKFLRALADLDSSIP